MSRSNCRLSHLFFLGGFALALGFGCGVAKNRSGVEVVDLRPSRMAPNTAATIILRRSGVFWPLGQKVDLDNFLSGEIIAAGDSYSVCVMVSRGYDGDDREEELRRLIIRLKSTLLKNQIFGSIYVIVE